MAACYDPLSKNSVNLWRGALANHLTASLGLRSGPKSFSQSRVVFTGYSLSAATNYLDNRRKSGRHRWTNQLNAGNKVGEFLSILGNIEAAIIYIVFDWNP
ncbi:hypothetical protein [Pseudomonas corrugata]|uniref:hypothetical protein n=1 Tax=Pseudomonas corrugata TaxID=47879 RepID=UPI003B973322